METETHMQPERPIFDEVKASLLYLKELGLHGVECTDDAAKLLGTIGRKPIGKGTPEANPRREVATPDASARVQHQQTMPAESVQPAMGKPSVQRHPSAPDHAPAMASSTPSKVISGPIEDTLISIQADMGECTRCRLFRGRNRIVFGSGASDARLMIIGDMPLPEDDRGGLPFLGPSGVLLDKMLQAMGLHRNDVYLSNILKCCPAPGMEKPDYGQCLSFLERQIAVVKPEVICTMGAVAAQVLLGMTSGVAGIRGQFQNYRGIRLMPTFHPTFLMNHPERKGDAWRDLQQVMQVLGLGR